jgi:hypothetical protein
VVDIGPIGWNLERLQSVQLDALPPPPRNGKGHYPPLREMPCKLQRSHNHYLTPRPITASELSVKRQKNTSCPGQLPIDMLSGCCRMGIRTSHSSCTYSRLSI